MKAPRSWHGYLAGRINSGIVFITSSHNTKIKQARALRSRKARQESGLFLIEGIRHIGEAIQAQIEIEYLLYAPDMLSSKFADQMIQDQLEIGIPCLRVTPEVFSSVADKENPQGLLAVAKQRSAVLKELQPSNFAWGVAVVDPQDPGNIGSIFRSIDAVGASGMLLLSSHEDTSGMVDPYHPSCVRASMGTLFWLPFARATFNDFSHWINEHHYHITGTSAHGTVDYRDIDLQKRPNILLLGSEREGLTESQSGVCSTIVRLPMQGKASSLNISVAAGVLLYAMMPK